MQASRRPSTIALPKATPLSPTSSSQGPARSPTMSSQRPAPSPTSSSQYFARSPTSISSSNSRSSTPNSLGATLPPGSLTGQDPNALNDVLRILSKDEKDLTKEEKKILKSFEKRMQNGLSDFPGERENILADFYSIGHGLSQRQSPSPSPTSSSSPLSTPSYGRRA